MAPRRLPWKVSVKEHPGSSADDIKNEPNWQGGHHHHRVGFRNRDHRRPGITSERDQYDSEIQQALKDQQYLNEQTSKGKLVNFRDIIDQQPDFHLRHPQNRSLGWRYVLNETEDWVKNGQEWPINIKKREKEDSGKEEDGSARQETNKEASSGKSQDSHERGDSDAEKGDEDSQSESGAEKLEARYSPEEIAFLRALQQEKEHFSTLRVNDGKQRSPQTQNRSEVSIDEQDQFTPDNWLPRCTDLIRLTGKHPLNAEAPLAELYSAGLITPNELHYVRNHGAVPRLLWEFHKVDVEYGAIFSFPLISSIICSFSFLWGVASLALSSRSNTFVSSVSSSSFSLLVVSSCSSSLMAK